MLCLFAFVLIWRAVRYEGIIHCGEPSYLLNTEAKDVIHIGWEQSQQSVEGPVVREMGNYYRPQRQRC